MKQHRTDDFCIETWRWNHMSDNYYYPHEATWKSVKTYEANHVYTMDSAFNKPIPNP